MEGAPGPGQRTRSPSWIARFSPIRPTSWPPGTLKESRPSATVDTTIPVTPSDAPSCSAKRGSVGPMMPIAIESKKQGRYSGSSSAFAAAVAVGGRGAAAYTLLPAMLPRGPPPPSGDLWGPD